MKVTVLSLVIFATTGCASVYMSIYDEDRLDRNLSTPMSKEQVLEEVGKPDNVLIDDGHTSVWEYRLYRREASVRNLPWVLAWGFGLIVPVEDRTVRKWVVLVDNQLCKWGNPSLVTTRATCMQASSLQPTPGSSTTFQPFSPLPRESDQFFTIQPLYVQMPKPIDGQVKRIAVIHPIAVASLSASFIKDIQLIVGQAAFSLRSRLPSLEIVERHELDKAVSELRLQVSGLVRDEDMLAIGRMSGVDHLLLYEISAPTDQELLRMTPTGGVVHAIVSWKLLRVETGTVPYQETVVEPIIVKQVSPPRKFEEMDQFRRMAVLLCFQGLYASLHHAFFPKDLGLGTDFVPTERGFRIRVVLGGSPAERMGLKPGDLITKIDGVPVKSADDGDKVAPGLTSTLTVKRGSDELELRVPKQP